MGSREDMLAALSGKLPDRVPTWELEFHLWQKFTDRKYVVGTPFTKLSEAEQAAQLEENAQAMVEVAEKLGFAGITIPAWYWEAAPGEPTFSWLPEPARETLLKRLKELAGDRFFFVSFVGGVLGMPPAHRYVDFSCQLMEEPEEIDRLARERCDEGLRQVERWAALGSDGFLIPADLAMNTGPYYSPEQMNRFVYPYMKEIADAVRAKGGFCILHTDGNIMPLIEKLAGTGIHAIQALDPIAGMDLAKVKAAVGDRLTLCGNVDCCALLAGTPEQVREQTFQCLEKGKPGGRFVLGVSNVVEFAGPKENFQALVDAWKEAGRY
jgi:uroporphyrinogen decarboxylase